MKQQPENEILFVSSFPPRECGIATYTQDLMNAITEKFGESFSLKICPIENNKTGRDYGADAKFILNDTDPLNYIETAKKINNDKKIKAVFVQHEFGLFGGQLGELLLYFLYSVDKPVITAFHTVLPNPDKNRLQIVKAISDVSQSIIVMTKNSEKILKEEYRISENKISVIPHGTHLVTCGNKSTTKAKFELEGKNVLSTFGLLSEGKCIETALDALPAVIEKFPDTIYLILGKTHPEVVKRDGEKYREFLQLKITELGIEKNVRFVNKYLSLSELLEYLKLTDIYLFTSGDPNQAVSGTFSYAMGCSCPVISTPIPHAKELLGDNTGIIVDFKNPEQLSGAIIDLLSHPEKRKQIRLNALHKIRPTSWQNSAVAHAEIFSRVTRSKTPLKYSVPEMSAAHLKRMTTETGIIQFADISRPDISSGYTLDDNARALIAGVRHHKITRSTSDILLIDTYLNFVKLCQQEDGSFLNYVDEHGIFHIKNHYVNLEDSAGRAVWALGELMAGSNLLNNHFYTTAADIIEKAIPVIRKFESPRAIAFTIKGLYHYNIMKKDPDIKNCIAELADNLTSKYHKVFDKGWKWFEDYLTYANSVLPESLLYAYLATTNELYRHIAISSFDFLLSVTFMPEEIKVISNRGWHKKGDVINQFGEQPIDVAYTILALDIFYEVTGNEEYRRKIEIAFSWFHGNNHLHQIIYNPVTGGCQDGLEENNVNLNQGAESTVCYMIARTVMEKYMGIEEPVKKREKVFTKTHSPFVAAKNK